MKNIDLVSLNWQQKSPNQFIRCGVDERIELYKQYDEQLKTARVNAQAIIASSEKEAKDAVALEIGQARTDAANLIAQTNKELEAQKSLALEKLESQVDELSQLIKEKLLGKEVVL